MNITAGFTRVEEFRSRVVTLHPKLEVAEVLGR
jgi:hypothetical protein